MCIAPKLPAMPAPIKLPDPVKPLEPATVAAPLATPPPPEKTATYFGGAVGSDKVTASPTATRGFSSLRIRRAGDTGLNVPYV